MPKDMFTDGLEANEANDCPLSPLGFLSWAATVYPQASAVIYGDKKYSYSEFYERCNRLAGALATHGIGAGDVVAVIAPNVPAMVEAHYGVPMAGAVICPIDGDRDAKDVAYILKHSEACAVLVDSDVSDAVKKAVKALPSKVLVIDIVDENAPSGARIGKVDYEFLLQTGSANFEWPGVRDEWDPIALNYTQGRKGKPKGVVFHHRGAYLTATGDALGSEMHRGTQFLWTLPLHRSSGWCYVWAVTAAAGTHICLRDANDRDAILDSIRIHKVTHLCGTQDLLTLLAGSKAKPEKFKHHVQLNLVAIPSKPAELKRLTEMGLDARFYYGMTESLGIVGLCAWNEEDSSIGKDDPSMLARATAHHPTLDNVLVVDPETMERQPADGKSVGEVVLRGNTVMKGYLKDPEANKRAFREGWFHTGDMGVIHPDGSIEIVEYSKKLGSKEK